MTKKIVLLAAMATIAVSALKAQNTYTPTAENLESRKEFADMRFGIFLHWGLYSTFAQGEWYMQNAGITFEEYSKAASGFYPSRFNAREWVAAIKASGAGYITITTRHHEGFSMWATKQWDYNIVDATPFKRDIIGELAEECHRQGIRLHLYYSHLDWAREDYPMGRTGTQCGKDPKKADWPKYYSFMNAQLTELLTNYGKIGAIWFDGWWDHDSDPTPFDWQLDEQYALIHRLQPACLVGNNHHMSPNPGEDIQIFERDLPGENKAGFVDQAAEISRLPLETCETMNGMWGYKVQDQNYKTTKQLIHYLVNTAGKGANLLMNIGPQPNGELPATAVQRLKEMGEWMQVYGSTIRATKAGDVPVQEWGATTRRDDKLYVHILNYDRRELYLPLQCKVVKAATFADGKRVGVTKTAEGVVLTLPEVPNGYDYVVELQTK